MRVTHFGAVHPRLAAVQRDNWRLRRSRRAGGDPLLADVLPRLPPGTAVVLDLKDDRGTAGARLVDALRHEPSLAGHPLLVTGHNWADVATAAAALRAVPLFTVGRAQQLPQVYAGDPAPPPGSPWGLAVRARLLRPGVIERLLECTGLLVAWTVNDVNRAERLLARGVRGIVSDRGAVLRIVATAYLPPNPAIGE